MTVIEPVVKPKKGDVYAIVTDKIIDALEAGTVPWHQPWDPSIGMPVSMSSGKPYRGMNIWLLTLASHFTSPWWGTYKKITELGGQVRKGEKSTMVTLWSPQIREATADKEASRWMLLRYYLVFNADQADDLPDKYRTAPGGFVHDPITEAQAVLDGYVNQPGGPKFTNVADQGACYWPFGDEIMMPPFAAFPEVASYYAAAFHESTHSTGHHSRLKREGVKGGHYFGDEEYSREELIAEMGAAMLAGVVGLEPAVLDRSASYIQSWIDVLKGDTKLVISAAGQAQKAADLILGTTFDADEDAS